MTYTKEETHEQFKEDLFNDGIEKGKLEERKEIVKLFYYEIHNNFVNFETLKKLVKLSEEISSEEGKR